MFIRVIKYLLPLTMYFAAAIAFTSYGWLCYLPLIYGFVVVPLLELLTKPRASNLNAAEEEIAKADRRYDYMLYLIVFLQLPTLFYFLFHLQDKQLGWIEITGRVGSMGLLCGSFGINVGHELGHRVNRFEQALAKLSLMTSLYMHFFIEHNKGHHKNVATPHDPSSARFGEMLYAFWPRTIYYSYISAWHIANEEARKKSGRAFTWCNEMVQAHVIQLVFVGLIFFMFDVRGLACFLVAAIIGILLLETVNYIEHYGLSRKETKEGSYERAMPEHSWNSNHLLGRLMLFELSRHSDHHYLASRKYQVLRHHEDSPQMPTGYPGMMLLSLLPPLWFRVMNKKLKEIRSGKQTVSPGAFTPA